MKKVLFVMFVVLMLSFTAAFAQETVTELPELNFSTVGDIFGWGDQAEDVYNFLSFYEGDLTADEENYSVSLVMEDETTYTSYDFYFDEETEGLWSFDCAASLPEGADLSTAVADLIKEYGMDQAEPYDDEELNEMISVYDAGAVVAGDKTIVAIATADETEDTYAMVRLYFIDREYYEAE